ncbi:hypothetical protein H8356DRAFT_1363740 [Neocallimastix lanati (nom. inval.)]|nr:hypothetical protein H8356DRAFT_1363740 [Neocallimastix sp. JGI-2020a]
MSNIAFPSRRIQQYQKINNYIHSQFQIHQKGLEFSEEILYKGLELKPKILQNFSTRDKPNQLGEMQHFNTTPLGEMQSGEMQFGEITQKLAIGGVGFLNFFKIETPKIYSRLKAD